MSKLNTPPWSNAHGPADGGRIPANRTPSYKAGGSVIREAQRGTEGRNMHVGGGCKDSNERSLDQHASEVEAGGKRKR